MEEDKAKNPSKLILLIHKAFLKYPEYFQNKKIFLIPSLIGFILLIVFKPKIKK